MRVGRTFGPNNNNRLGTGAGRSTEASRLRATRKPVGAAAKSSAIPVGAAAIPVGAAKSASSCSSQARNISASRSSSHAAPSSSAEFPGSGVGAAGAAVGGATGSEQRSRFTMTGGRGSAGRSRFTTTGGRGVEGRSRFAASRRGPDKPALEDATCGVAGARGTAQPPARRASTSQQKVKKRTEFVNFKIRSMRLFRFQVC